MARTTDPPNPFYFGYYPGQPIKPKRYYVPRARPGEDIDWLEMDAVLDSLDDTMTPVPRWFWENIKRDYKSSLRAVVTQQESVSVEQLAAFGEEVVEDMPGAFGISVSLNPMDWAKDPAGQAKDTLKSWGSAAFNWNDFENEHRMKMWIRILSAPDSPGVEKESRLQREAMAALSTGVAGPKTPSLEGYHNPLSLDAPELQAIKSKERPHMFAGTEAAPEYMDVPAYASLKESIPAFQLNVKNSPKRESMYDEVLYDASIALKWDLDAHGENLSDVQKRVADKFTHKVDFTTSVRGFKIGVSGNRGASKVLDRFMLTGVVAPYRAEETVVEVNANLIKGIKRAREGIDKLTPMDRRELAGIIGSYEKMLTKFEKLTVEGGSLKKFEDAVNAGETGATRIRILAARAKRDVDSIQKEGFLGAGLSGGDYFSHFKPSIERGLLRGLEYDIKEDKDGVFGTQTAGGKKLKLILNRMERERSYASVEEFVNAFESERMLRTYVWPRFKNKFETFTPAYWSSKALARHHHFGLVVNNNMVTEDREGLKVGFLFFQGTVKGTGLSRFLLNKFKVNEKVTDERAGVFLDTC